MAFSPNRFRLMLPEAKTITPTQSDGEQREEFAHAGMNGQMGIFQMKPMRFQRPEHGFDLPAPSIIVEGGLWARIRDQDEIVVGQAEANHIDGDAPDPAWFRQEMALADRDGPKIARGGSCPAASPQRNAGIAANPQSKGNVVFHQKAKPETANKLPVGGEALNPFCAKLAEKFPEQAHPFSGIGVAAFVSERPIEGDGHSSKGDGEDENIQIGGAELPVGAIQTENPFLGQGEQSCH